MTCLFNEGFSVSLITQSRMVDDYGFERIWTKAIEAFYKALSQNSSAETQDT